MQREIKFKAKSIEENSKGHWVEGNLILGNDRYGNLYAHIEHSDFHDFAKWEVEPDTICQFTGLYDRDGNEVWEYDVVDLWDYEHPLTDKIEYCGRFTIEWLEDESGFAMLAVKSENDYYPHRIMSVGWKKVIGNRFDNKELLNE